MQPLIISYSGIRGIAGESLTEEVALRFGRAFGRMVERRHASPTILLGRDTRPSGGELLRGVIRGLGPFGRLVDLGVVATPPCGRVPPGRYMHLRSAPTTNAL